MGTGVSGPPYGPPLSGAAEPGWSPPGGEPHADWPLPGYAGGAEVDESAGGVELGGLTEYDGYGPLGGAELGGAAGVDWAGDW